MHIHYISEKNSILNHFLTQLRDVTIQKDSMRFRKNIERIGEIMAYEMSKKTVDAEPENATYLDTFGWILFKMGEYMEAKAIFKQTLLYGGKENADILDHYAETLFKLKEYDLAFIYWDQAKALDPSLGIDKKIEQRKKEMTK